MAEFELKSLHLTFVLIICYPKCHYKWLLVSLIATNSLEICLFLGNCEFSFHTTPTPNAIYFCLIQTMESDELKLEQDYQLLYVGFSKEKVSRFPARVMRSGGKVSFQ